MGEAWSDSSRKHSKVPFINLQFDCMVCSMLDVHRLRVFRSVVASGSIQAAAGNLGYTSSAVSQHVSALQRETGLALVTRVGRGIEPTAAGLALAPRSTACCPGWARSSRWSPICGPVGPGRSSIAYFASVGSAWMPTVVATMLAEFPNVRLNLVLRDDVPTEPAERADVQIVVEQGALHRPGRRPGTCSTTCTSPSCRRHPLAAQPELDLAALAGDPWVDNDFARGWCRRNLIEACHAAGFTRRSTSRRTTTRPRSPSSRPASVSPCCPARRHGTCRPGAAPCRWRVRRRCDRSTRWSGKVWRTRRPTATVPRVLF